MRWRRHGVGRNIIVRMAQHVRGKEDQRREQEEEQRRPNAILGGVIGVERNRILLRFHFHARRVGRPWNVQRPNVEDDDTQNHKRQQIVEREEPVQRRIIRRKSAQKPCLDRLTHQRDRAEQAGDDLRPPEAHLAPRKDITHEGGGHHKQEDDKA